MKIGHIPYITLWAAKFDEMIGSLGITVVKGVRGGRAAFRDPEGFALEIVGPLDPDEPVPSY